MVFIDALTQRLLTREVSLPAVKWHRLPDGSTPAGLPLEPPQLVDQFGVPFHRTPPSETWARYTDVSILPLTTSLRSGEVETDFSPPDPVVPAVEIAVEVSARVICSRCAKPMLMGERTFKVTARSANVEIPVIGLCPCLRSWNGRGQDLLSEPSLPATPVPLAAHDGEGTGDGVPRGTLRPVDPGKDNGLE